MGTLVQAFNGAVSLLASLASRYDFTALLLPENDGSYQYNEFVASDGRRVVLLGQRANLGRLSEATLSMFRTDILGAFTESSVGAFGRGFQLVDQPYWIPRSDSVLTNQPEKTIQNTTMLLVTPDHLLISPIEVFGFLFPEPPEWKITEFLRPAVNVIAGQELVSRGWLTNDSDNRLFTTGYAFHPEKLRDNPYPYGPGAFDLATKTFDFIRLPDGTIQVRMLALFFPTLQDRFGAVLGFLATLVGFESFAFSTHATIHFEAIQRVAKFSWA